MKKILLLEDDITFSKMLSHFLERHQYKISESTTISTAKKLLENTTFDLIFTDLRLPDGNGIDFLKYLKTNKPKVPVVLLTSYAEVSTAVKAMKEGAFDYISKPLNTSEVLEVITNALEIKHKKNNLSGNTEIKSNQKKEFVTGVSNVSKMLSNYINLVAPTSMSVLITGESGTGKEVVAKSIHLQSARKDKPFIAVDCGSIPKEIASSELFGHKKGSFTGAIEDKIGHFEAANEGTLFLDEVGNLSYENQIQLLRALQERKVKPVGSSKEILVDIRLVAATNEDLLQAVEKGTFREDLYHRLNEFSLKVPSLSQRTEDLIIFADYFLDKANRQLNKQVAGFSKEVLAIFQQYNWPGNLRELSNVIKRATLLTNESIVIKEALPIEVLEPNKQVENFNTFSAKENEKQLIVGALKKADNNKTQAAKLLNMNRKTLYNKLKEYNINQ